MGIPKFFRWISERYPLINVPIEGTLAPRIDNLYLDMNGIIHNCTHPTEDITARISERDMVLAILAYIDKLFHAIKPRKLFFMAVDGPAPRAKMNQQRARRFRSAKDAREAREKAEAEGKELPKEPAFDSNVITPGTDFMDRLTQHLLFFVRQKINEDPSWRTIDVIFSGQEVPGEGEHKIMQHIRLMKNNAQCAPDIQHCIYGLDADLMMLGLATHEPNFCLLREEVLHKASRGSRKDIFQASRFHFLSLSLVREYLELEFLPLKTSLPFEFSLERILDDFVFLCFFIGNDFLPNLPLLDISEGSMDLLLEMYTELLPGLDGYLTEKGVLKLNNVGKFMAELASREEDMMTREDGSFDQLSEVMEALQSQGKEERNDLEDVLEAALKTRLVAFHADKTSTVLTSPTGLSGLERKAWHVLCEKYGLISQSQGEGDERVVVVTKPKVKPKKSKKGKAEHPDWRQEYYAPKMRHSGITEEDTPENISRMAFFYAQGLQWVLHYYYHGCVSWGWYYPYHYAPLAYDLVNIASFEAVQEFELGAPFKQYEQLLAVLPAVSGFALPDAYRQLMVAPNSPIIDYYPTDFELDPNGKRNDWEFIVLIPFIDEKRLLSAIETVDQSSLTDDERRRNMLGKTILFKYNPADTTFHKSTLPGIIPDIKEGHSVTVGFDMPTNLIENECFRLLPGAGLGVDAPDLTPTMHSLPFASTVKQIGCNVFGFDSRKPTMVVTPNPPPSESDLQEGEDEAAYLERIAEVLVGKTVIVEWPHWQAAKVVSISTRIGAAHLNKLRPGHSVVNWQGNHGSSWVKEAKAEQAKLLKTRGIDCGDIDVLVTVAPLYGMRMLEDGSTQKFYSYKESRHPLQMTLVEPPRPLPPRWVEQGPTPLPERYPIGMEIVYNGKAHFGLTGKVTGYQGDKKLIVELAKARAVPRFGLAIAASREPKWYESNTVCRMVGMSNRSLSQITSSFRVKGKGKQDLALGIKFSKRREQIVGWARATEVINHTSKLSLDWEYSQHTVDALKQYKRRFPEVFRCLANHKNNDRSKDRKYLTAFDIFGGDNAEALQKLEELIAWLNELPVRKVKPVPMGSCALDEIAMASLEQRVIQMLEQQKKEPPVFTVHCSPFDVRRPVSDLAFVDPNAPTAGNFSLGQRVCSILADGPIPFASMGFVVATTGTTVSVLFDKELPVGTSVGGVFQGPKFVSGLPAESLFNMSLPAKGAFRPGDKKSWQLTDSAAKPVMRKQDHHRGGNNNRKGNNSRGKQSNRKGNNGNNGSNQGGNNRAKNRQERKSAKQAAKPHHQKDKQRDTMAKSGPAAIDPAIVMAKQPSQSPQDPAIISIAKRPTLMDPAIISSSSRGSAAAAPAAGASGGNLLNDPAIISSGGGESGLMFLGGVSGSSAPLPPIARGQNKHAAHKPRPRKKCRFFAKGDCKFGAKCRFSHE